MRATPLTHLILLGTTLVVASISVLLLALPWYHLTAAGRLHSYYLGSLPLFPIVDSFPFSWPFALAAFTYRCLGSTVGALIWSLATALAGVALYCLITRVQFAAYGASIGAYVSVATQFAAPAFYSVIGFLVGHLLRITQKT